MGLSTPRMTWGVHSLTLYDRSNWMPYGIMKVVGSISTALKGDFKDLYGGSSKFPWDSEPGTLDCSVNVNIKECPNFAFEKFLGATATANAAEASGNCGTLTNKYGTSVKVATTGIASATVKSGSEADLKDAIIVLKCTAATKVKVFAMTDVDFDKGTDLTFNDDDLNVIASAAELTIATGGDVDVTSMGIKLTGGSGTIGMTIGDTAYVYTRKVNAKSSLITVGQTPITFPAFGMVAAAAKKGNGDVTELQFFNCKGIGLPLSFKESDWMGSDISIRAMYDSTENCVFKLRNIVGA